MALRPLLKAGDKVKVRLTTPPEDQEDPNEVVDAKCSFDMMYNGGPMHATFTVEHKGVRQQAFWPPIEE